MAVETPSASAIVDSLIFCASAPSRPVSEKLAFKQFKGGLMPPIFGRSKLFCQFLVLRVRRRAALQPEPVLAVYDIKSAGHDDRSAGDRPANRATGRRPASQSRSSTPSADMDRAPAPRRSRCGRRWIRSQWPNRRRSPSDRRISQCKGSCGSETRERQRRQHQDDWRESRIEDQALRRFGRRHLAGS